MKRSLTFILAGSVVVVALTAAMVAKGLSEDRVAGTPSRDPALQIERGRYLVAAGDCETCHTARGGAPWAGGLNLDTPFGTIYSTNITPDRDTGIGGWSADDLWRTLHNGKSRDGTLLYPAMPFTNTTRVTRADSDAIFAYLQTLPPVHSARRANVLHFPFNQRFLLAFWRALYFSPQVFQNDPTQSPAWNRGAYLVEGLGHCDACHANRNLLGATETSEGLSGGEIPVMSWYAPSLGANDEAGLKDWDAQDLERFLHTGTSMRAAAYGPMAEVVEESLQNLTSDDIAAITLYLQHQPGSPSPAVKSAHPLASNADLMDQGKRLFHDNCAVCHQDDGSGSAPAVPPLAGNRSLTMQSAVNPIRMVLLGGFAPATHGDPRPYSMPPFAQALSSEQIAAIVSYIRNAWGNQAPAVIGHEVDLLRDAPAD